MSYAVLELADEAFLHVLSHLERISLRRDNVPLRFDSQKVYRKAICSPGVDADASRVEAKVPSLVP